MHNVDDIIYMPVQCIVYIIFFVVHNGSKYMARIIMVQIVQYNMGATRLAHLPKREHLGHNNVWV